MAVSIGERFGYSGDNWKPSASTTNNINFVLSICRRNLCPIPLLIQAPSIKPGKSAIVIFLESSYSKLATVGSSVVTVMVKYKGNCKRVKVIVDQSYYNVGPLTNS